MALSPGVRFLVRLVIHVFSKPIVLGFGVHYLSKRAGFHIPVWATILLTAASLPLYVTYRVLRKQARQRREAEAMGARLAPTLQGKWLGNLDWMRKMVYLREHGYPGDGIDEAIAELGPVFNMRVLWMDSIMTICPEHMKLILSTDFNNYVKGERFQFGMNSVLGSGVFNSDGEMWKFHRAMTRPFFSRDKISHFDIFDSHAEDVIAIIKERTRAGYAVDFQDLIGRFTMDSATQFLFGTCVHSLKANIPYAHNVAFPPPQSNSAQAQVANKFIAAFNDAMQVVAEREYIGSIWPLWEIMRDKTEAPMKVVSAFLDPIIAAAIERKRLAGGLTAEKRGGDGNVEADTDTLLDELLNSTVDPKVLKDETLNILLAGRDTTMHVMTMVIYFLSTHPSVCTRLREEVLTHVGPARRPTYDDIRDMKYLRAVINESMRLFPSVPFNVKECIETTTWPSPNPNEKPIYIPAGAKVPFAAMLMHRRADLWGPDVDEFSPDRFLDERLKKYLLNNPFQFLPFNAGPRICLGQQFAYNEMSFMIIRLLQSFESFSLDEAAFSPEGRPPKEWATASGRKGIDRFRPRTHLTMYTADGMWITVKEAASAGAES
ncbi:Cytochrome P450 [Mycena sanguinolenta]|uniref:Cytochrome P450 n=1 Tax=Mycena sanguinolenta TaxID=230812 RepID=A0A8H6Z330_9AGAR|nr:Cytochrome P450 [Mycena sanguinolenta]